MKHWLALCTVVCAVQLAAQDNDAESEQTSIEAFATLTNSSCLSLATGRATIGSSVEDDLSTVESFGFVYGINGPLYERFGQQGQGVLNRAIMGHQSVGSDDIVLAVGGALPGCKVIFLSDDTEGLADPVADAFTQAEESWKELPFAETRPGSTVQKRSFLHRDASGEPFLLNLIYPFVPDSDIRIVATVSRVPPTVRIPEGF